MDLRKIKALVELISTSNITELEVAEDEGKVRIVKGPSGNISMNHSPHLQYIQASPSNPIVADISSPSIDITATTITETNKSNLHIVKSPMVGTLYLASSPGATPFVKVGDSVKEGQTLCIIEAMKLLNEIEADKSGVIKEVLMGNGQPVEYGQALFSIE